MYQNISNNPPSASLQNDSKNQLPRQQHPRNPQYAPITQQPTFSTHQHSDADERTAISSVVSSNAGLQYLMTVDRLFVKQQMEIAYCVESNNEYVIKNIEGREVFSAMEVNTCFRRNCDCQNTRSFDMKIVDYYKNEIITFHRPCTCCCDCCFPSCRERLDVFSPPGTLIGSVEARQGCCSRGYDINDENGVTVLNIEVPKCCGGVQEYKVMSQDKSYEVGKIMYSEFSEELPKEIFPDDFFHGVFFPSDLDVRMKAVLLAASFLIDFRYWLTLREVRNNPCG